MASHSTPWAWTPWLRAPRVMRGFCQLQWLSQGVVADSYHSSSADGNSLQDSAPGAHQSQVGKPRSWRVSLLTQLSPGVFCWIAKGRLEAELECRNSRGAASPPDAVLRTWGSWAPKSLSPGVLSPWHSREAGQLQAAWRCSPWKVSSHPAHLPQVNRAARPVGKDAHQHTQLAFPGMCRCRPVGPRRV